MRHVVLVTNSKSTGGTVTISGGSNNQLYIITTLGKESFRVGLDTIEMTSRTRLGSTHPQIRSATCNATAQRQRQSVLMPRCSLFYRSIVPRKRMYAVSLQSLILRCHLPTKSARLVPSRSVRKQDFLETTQFFRGGHHCLRKVHPNESV
jgi:hypothetical protein